MVGPHDLERRLVRLTPGRAEQEERVGNGHERRQPLGEFRGHRVRQAQVERRPLERAGLLGHRGPDLLASVSDRAGAEVPAGVEEPAAVVVDHVGAFAAHQDAG